MIQIIRMTQPRFSILLKAFLKSTSWAFWKLEFFLKFLPMAEGARGKLQNIATI
jgi:hypothetical protein